MNFTKEQAEENGRAVAAFLQGQPIEFKSMDGTWRTARNVLGIDETLHRPAPEPELAPPVHWSRIEHVPLNAWMKHKNSPNIYQVRGILPSGLQFGIYYVRWEELYDYLYTTGEKDANGELIFRECIVP